MPAPITTSKVTRRVIERLDAISNETRRISRSGIVQRISTDNSCRISRPSNRGSGRLSQRISSMEKR